MRAGSQTVSMPMASSTAAVTWGFDRAVTKKLTLRARHPARNPSVHPAESARTMTVLFAMVASSPLRWPVAIVAGSWAIAWSRTFKWSETVLAPALPGRSTPDSTSPVASAKQNIGWKPNPPL